MARLSKKELTAITEELVYHDEERRFLEKELYEGCSDSRRKALEKRISTHTDVISGMLVTLALLGYEITGSSNTPIIRKKGENTCLD